MSMIALINHAATIAASLTAATNFTSNSGDPAKIVYHENVMPARAKGTDEEIAPFCLVRISDFSLYPSRRQTVELLFCLYQPDRADAITDLETLAALLEPLALRGKPWTGCKIESITGNLGEKDTGVQPHPYYYFTLRLSLISAHISRQGALP